MSKLKLEELVEDLKLAKEANNLTVSNIGKIVSEATTNIVKELKFDKEMTSDIVSDVVNNATTTLKELGEDTADNIKASSDAALNGVQNALKTEMESKSKKLTEVFNKIKNDKSVTDLGEILDDFKSFSESSLEH
ncbi:MAG: hypothetical protein KAJ49_05025, partial [Arcobacteraceae bacterium]|nr:hypothetical protein [Arcobacteraceae bacterium]